jgi:hypothetical protein
LTAHRTMQHHGRYSRSSLTTVVTRRKSLIQCRKGIQCYVVGNVCYVRLSEFLLCFSDPEYGRVQVGSNQFGIEIDAINDVFLECQFTSRSERVIDYIDRCIPTEDSRFRCEERAFRIAPHFPMDMQFGTNHPRECTDRNSMCDPKIQRIRDISLII